MSPLSLTGGQSAPQSLHQLHDAMTNFVFNVCSILTAPVEFALRPQFGSTYFPPVILFFAAAVMAVVPLFLAVAGTFASMIPFVRFRGSFGLIGMFGFSKLFFMGALIHGARVWYRMTHMETEENSAFEGEPLPIFRVLPFSFFTIRIVIEPLFVFALSIFLPAFYIVETSLGNYLTLLSILLAMKSYCAWYTEWLYLRRVLDMRNMGSTLARFIENTASAEQLNRWHLPGLPKDVPEPLRRAAATFIARAYSLPSDNDISEKGKNNESQQP